MGRNSQLSLECAGIKKEGKGAPDVVPGSTTILFSATKGVLVKELRPGGGGRR